MIQIVPSCRIKEQKYLVNGKTLLEEGKVTTCDFLDIEEEYDIISPDSLLNAIRNNPGKEPAFTADKIDSVLTNHIIYRFQPMGVCTIEYKSHVNRKFNLGYMGFIQSAPLSKLENYDSHLYYIPKTLPFERKGIKYDFKSIQDFSAKLPVPLYFNEKEKNIESPNNLPERFIQFLGKKETDKNVNRVGFAIGYSLIKGITKPEERTKTSNNSLMIFTSSKSYPYAIDSKMGAVPAGKEFHCFAYNQYFDPAAYKNATSVYWHKQDSAYVLYIDYHKSIDNDIIKLPSYLSGRKIAIIEKTSSVELLTKQTIPSEGIELSVNNNYGYIVLKLDDSDER